MIDKLYDFVDRLSTWPIVAILVVILVLTNQAYIGRREIIGNQIQLLESRRWYTPTDAEQFIGDLRDQNQVPYYVGTKVTLDVIYPITYGLLFAILLARTWGPRFTWTLLFPFFTLVFNLLESGTIVYLFLTYDNGPSNVAWFAATCTMLKTILFLFSLVLVLNGGIVRLFRVSLY